VNHSLIAVRYAKALFKLAKESDQLEKIHQDLLLVDKTLNESTDFKYFIESPIQKVSKKKEILAMIFKDNIQVISTNFLNLVIEKNREELLQQIIRDYNDFYRQDQNIRDVTFISATKLDESFYSSLKATLESSLKSSIELTIKEDNNLVGGFIITVDGKLMDASIANKLKRLKKQLLN
jgi:F-type H+-transporting ATPase subunit delta